MTFCDYTIKFLSERLPIYEKNDILSNEMLLEVKVLLKMYEDIIDEGYHFLEKKLIEELDAFNRLKNIIIKNNDVPFPMVNNTITKKIVYNNDIIELDSFLEELDKEEESNKEIKNKYLYDIINYCKYLYSDIGKEEDTTYVFLLRDGLMPYLYFKKKNYKNIKALLIGRKYLNLYSKYEDEIYDYIHGALFNCLDKEINDFNLYRNSVKKEILSKLKKYNILNDISILLNEIKTKKIMIVESGYCGSIPMLLSVLDDRIDFKMFSTVPYFYNVYKNKIFTYSFEKMRIFETIQAQDSYFILRKIENNKFYISISNNKEINDKAINEIKEWYKLIKES